MATATATANDTAAVSRIVTAASNGAVRHATFNGRAHLVVPVVAMVGDIVIRPANSDGAEFVPADVIAHMPIVWNNRPVLPDHPQTETYSANDPQTLEAFQYGTTFNATFANNRLCMEAWLDIERANVVG